MAMMVAHPQQQETSKRCQMPPYCCLPKRLRRPLARQSQQWRVWFRELFREPVGARGFLYSVKGDVLSGNVDSAFVSIEMFSYSQGHKIYRQVEQIFPS